MKKGHRSMKTLEKIWEDQTQEDNERDEMEIEEETAEKSTKNSKNTTTDTETSNDDNIEIESNDETTPLFPMSIRFKIMANDEKTARKKHITVLQAIKEEMQHFELYKTDNYKTNIENIQSEDFTFHPIGKKNKGYIVIHRIIIDKNYYNIKSHKNILQVLKETNSHIYHHMWTTSEWDIVNLGFISGASPKHQAKDTIPHKMNLAINTPVDFHLKANNIKITHQGNTTSTFAYELFCKRKEINEICDAFTKSSHFTGFTLIKQQWKYSNPTIYANGINKQNEFIKNISTIPIYGITTDGMSYIYSTIVSNKNVLEISRTGKTKDHGRWNVYTTKTNFHNTTKWLKDNLEEIYEDKCLLDSDDVPPSFKPEVRFSTTITFDRKPDPMIAITEKALDKFFDDPNHTRSWASVASANTTPSTITPNSNMTITIQQLTESIQKLCNRLDSIENTLNEHTTMIEKLQESNTEYKEHMDKLGTAILELEERASRITPRRLTDSYNDYAPNKRQDTRTSPSKNKHK